MPAIIPRCTQPLGEHQDCRGGTAASLRARFQAVLWAQADSGKVTLARPTHQSRSGRTPSGMLRDTPEGV